MASRLATKGILVTPGIALGAAGEGYIRWSLTVKTSLVEEAAELLTENLLPIP